MTFSNVKNLLSFCIYQPANGCCMLYISSSIWVLPTAKFGGHMLISYIIVILLSLWHHQHCTEMDIFNQWDPWRFQHCADNFRILPGLKKNLIVARFEPFTSRSNTWHIRPQNHVMLVSLLNLNQFWSRHLCLVL